MKAFINSRTSASIIAFDATDELFLSEWVRNFKAGKAELFCKRKTGYFEKISLADAPLPEVTPDMVIAVQSELLEMERRGDLFTTAAVEKLLQRALEVARTRKRNL